MIPKRLTILLLLFFALFLLSIGSAAAAETIVQEIYVVPADTVIEEDLYISANELYIEGRIEGDVVFLGAYAEISGEISGDFMAMATGVEISGLVEDDVRLLAAGVNILGEIGDDLITTGGGGAGFTAPLPVGTQSISQGVFLRGGQVNGDLLLASGLTQLSGMIQGDINGIVNTFVLQNATIEGSVAVQTFTLEIDEESRVLGEDGFQYTAPAPLDVNAALSENIVFEELPQPGIDWFARIRQAFGALAGFAILGYVLLRFRPNWLIAPAAIMTAAPGRCFFMGFITSLAFLFVPVLTMIVGVGIGLFWGFVSGFVGAAFVFTGLVLIWTFSPLIAGIWIGQRFSRQPFQAMLIGTAVIVALTLIPQIGSGLSIIVFMTALGALILYPRLSQLPPQV
ncbi:MAG: polymer-forming cytoskeletal protein [Ardenticatenaceae bacterium]|nr:polymer-forming cytoskeletal protein [Ardenticatenaceae bacterium]